MFFKFIKFVKSKEADVSFPVSCTFVSFVWRSYLLSLILATGTQKSSPLMLKSGSLSFFNMKFNAISVLIKFECGQQSAWLFKLNLKFLLSLFVAISYSCSLSLSYLQMFKNIITFSIEFFSIKSKLIPCVLQSL